MKTSQLSNTQLTIQTLREHAIQFNRVADVLEATERINSAGMIGRLGPRLVKRKMSPAARKKISLAQKARHQNKAAPVGKTAAA